NAIPRCSQMRCIKAAVSPLDKRSLEEEIVIVVGDVSWVKFSN
ncbi:MAG: hypothetical protein ACI814_000581, partial [Mariniblastus sp.]